MLWYLAVTESHNEIIMANRKRTVGMPLVWD
jgi:hypothetical protein